MQSDKDNYLETISETANVNSHITFIERLLRDHTWNNNRGAYYLSQLEKIKQKQNDTNMYLAVIGEFSSGKSSFINAMMRDELLMTNVIQGTTASATVINYGPSLDVAVEFKDKTVEEYSKNLSGWKKFVRKLFKPKDQKLKSEIREYITAVTANEEIAATVNKVTIAHPSESLKNGLVIIDTPGINADNERHEMVTINAIKTLADAAIIIMTSDQQLPKTLVNFIRDNLDEVISKCVFVVNMMDRVRVKEHDRVLSYVKTKLQMEFGVQNVNVVPYTSLAVIKSFSSETEFNCEQELQEELLKQSLQTEGIIYDTLKQQRLIIQLQKLIVLIGSMFQEMAADLRTMEQGYEKRHEALVKNTIKDLGTFIGAQKKLHRESLINNCQPVKQDIALLIEKSKQDLIHLIHENIYSFSNHGDLNNFMKKKLQPIMTGAQSELEQSLYPAMGSFQIVGTNAQSNFEREFKKLYTSLATLGGQMAVNDYVAASTAVGMVKSNFDDKFVGIKKSINSEENKLVGISLGGMVAGAAIGSVVPVVGTIIGGIIGSFAGLLFRKPLDELKNEYYNKINSSINDSYNSALDSVVGLEDEIVQKLIEDLYSNIDQYFLQYDALVKQMIRRDEEEKRKLEEMSKKINSDLLEMKNRQTVIENVQSKIRVL